MSVIDRTKYESLSTVVAFEHEVVRKCPENYEVLISLHKFITDTNELPKLIGQTTGSHKAPLDRVSTN